jgi:pumilio family protein 6
MARAVKGAGKGSALKRKDRRQAKYTPGPGPDSFKPVGVADKAVAVGEKEKKAPGKLSKKRKAEGGGSGAAAAANGDDKKHKFAKKTSGGSTGGGKDGKYAGSGGKDASWAKKAPLSNKHADAPKHVATTRKEQKAANDEKKAYQKPNFTLVTEIVTMWERLRVKKISAVDKRALVVSIFKACVGKVPDLANNHKGSRVIQALLKYGTKEEVAAIYGECTPQIAMLAKSLYGHFIVKKLVNPLNPKP